MNEATQAPADLNPQRDRPGEPAGGTPTHKPTDPAEPMPAPDESERLDQERRNPASEGSNYGFGTPEEGFGPRRQDRT